MNRCVLLEHKILIDNLNDIHYDFLIENESDCLTWKFFEIPSIYKGSIPIVKQSNHRLVWLSREKYQLSENRGFVQRIDYGTLGKFNNIFDSQNFEYILNGKFLNGLLKIEGNTCRLMPNNF